MTNAQIQPHKVRSPIQLLAVWFAALVLLDSAFLTAASYVDDPSWFAPMLYVAAVVFVPFFLVAAIVMQTKYRTHLQDDEHFSQWLKTKEKFDKFVPENIPSNVDLNARNLLNTESLSSNPETKRVSIYEKQHGLFLLHDWVPSRTPGQVADIIIWLHQHREGPLSQGEVERVEYHLGPMFFKGEPIVKTNSVEDFMLQISAYGPVLCLARIFTKGQGEPIDIYRYIDFELGPKSLLPRIPRARCR